MLENPKQDPKVREDNDMRAILDTLGDMRYTDAVQGKEIYNFFGGRVIEHITSKGDGLALIFSRWETFHQKS
jgi:hypothetical protein